MPRTEYSIQTTETLTRIANTIQESAATLRALAEAANGLHLEVGSYKSMEVGIEKIDTFIASVRDALVRARAAAGHFRAEEKKRNHGK